MIFNINDYTIVFLSYDEPNCEENFQRLLSIKPDALRVHGVKGSDNAHKAVAKLSKTKNVIIVDGDNFVKPSLFDTTLVLKPEIDINTCVLSYSGHNVINGCQYGNGGIKVWPVSLLESMETHENSKDYNSIDFDLDNYLQLNQVGSDVLVAASPLQAWRAGFREGVKLCMENGKIVDKLSDINWRNYDRLYRWTHVGTDIANGLWAIHGARLGTYMAVVQRMDISKVRDFDYLNHMFNESILPYQDILWHDCNRLGELINDKLIGDVLSISDSEQYKKLPSILRSEENFIKYKFHPPYDVVFISNDEPNSEKNFAILQEKVPEAKRATSLVEASKITSTDFFWAVDHNSIVVDQFDFEYNIDFFGPLKEYVFIAKNSKTGEFNKDGAVRLIPRMTAYRQETVPEEPVIIFSNITEK